MKEPDSLEQARQGRLRSGGEERRRGEQLLQGRRRALGQDGQGHRLLELDRSPRLSSSAQRRSSTVTCGGATSHYRLRQYCWMPAFAGMTRSRCRHERRTENPAPPVRPRPKPGSSPADKRAALERVAAQYAVAITPAMAALIDPADPRRSDRAASSFPIRPSSIAPGGNLRPDRRSRPQPGRRHRASLSRPRAAQAHPRLRGLLPVLLPPRDDRPAARRR